MCTAGYVYSDIIPNNDPRKFLRKLVLGMREEALKDPYIWNCNVCERWMLKMKAICSDFREMYPNRQYNYCCGAGTDVVIPKGNYTQAVDDVKDFVKKIL